MKIGFVFTFNKPLWRWWLFEITLFKIETRSLLWKDKWNSPRVEILPHLQLTILNFVFTWYFGDDEYWEKRIWLKKYCKGDKVKAEMTWPWKKVLPEEITGELMGLITKK